ncbi:MAG: hypothetical protein HKN27_06845 [Silicimonas sp.]|nr:hypothetical protein [Silicimonas sp.]
MSISSERNLEFKDGKDWAEAVLCAIFLIVFPIAIIALWKGPQETVPLYFLLPFTGIFLICVPLLIRAVLIARSRTITVDRKTGEVSVTSRAPVRNDRQRFAATDIDAAVFRTTDNDGYWYTALLRTPGQDVVFAQGSHRPDVRKKFEAMVAELRRFAPALKVEEVTD